jgi:hypothetical protein
MCDAMEPICIGSVVAAAPIWQLEREEEGGEDGRRECLGW